MYPLGENSFPKWHFKWQKHGTHQQWGGGGVKRVSTCQSGKAGQHQPTILDSSSPEFHKKKLLNSCNIQWACKTRDSRQDSHHRVSWSSRSICLHLQEAFFVVHKKMFAVSRYGYCPIIQGVHCKFI